MCVTGPAIPETERTREGADGVVQRLEDEGDERSEVGSQSRAGFSTDMPIVTLILTLFYERRKSNAPPFLYHSIPAALLYDRCTSTIAPILCLMGETV